MNRLLILKLLLFSVTALSAQFNQETRVLRLLSEGQDTVIHRLKHNASEEITLLHQSYFVYEDEDVFQIDETYKKGKYWTLWRFKEVVVKEKRRSTIVEGVPDGKQYQFNENGQPILVEEYSLGVPNALYYWIEYYEDGSLMGIFEVKDEELWNVVAYKYPDGADYDFGDFKNGSGTIVYLNEAGVPCLECTVDIKGLSERVLCAEDATVVD